MQILLVDDDRFVLHALQSKIDWPNLGVTRIFTAANMQQAQEIIQNERINLLISDIEMPQGSGLELLAWLRNEGNQVQTIFLTNYADFNYAQKAIELQSFEYYLKPIDYEKLTLIIKKALLKVKGEKNFADYDSEAKKHIFESLFWERALSKPRLGKVAELLTTDDFKELTFDEDIDYALSLMTLFPYHINWEPFKITADSDLTRTVQTTIEELRKGFPTVKKISAFRRNNQPDTFLLVIPLAQTSQKNTLDLEFIEQLRLSLLSQVGWESLILTNQLCSFPEIEQSVIELFDEGDDAVRFRHAKSKEKEFWHQTVVATPITTEFEKLLANYRWEPCITFIQEVIKEQVTHGQVPSDYLKALKLDLMQSLHSFLNDKEILAHQLLQNSDHQFLAERSLNSIESFVDYFKYCIKTSLTYIEWSHSQKSVATIVKEYIDEHYAQEINRSTIADFVFLSPDHVARIFKKEMNTSLGAYIIERRLVTAEHLLTTTTLPINVIATKVGYDNYSYFTKLFKKHSKYTPQDFRQLFTP